MSARPWRSSACTRLGWPDRSATSDAISGSNVAPSRAGGSFSIASSRGADGGEITLDERSSDKLMLPVDNDRSIPANDSIMVVRSAGSY